MNNSNKDNSYKLHTNVKSNTLKQSALLNNNSISESLKSLQSISLEPNQQQASQVFKANILTDYLEKMLNSNLISNDISSVSYNNTTTNNVTNNSNINRIRISSPGVITRHNNQLSYGCGINFVKNTNNAKNTNNKIERENRENNFDNIASPLKNKTNNRVKSPKLLFKRKINESNSFLSNCLEENDNNEIKSNTINNKFGYRTSKGPLSSKDFSVINTKIEKIPLNYKHIMHQPSLEFQKKMNPLKKSFNYTSNNFNNSINNYNQNTKLRKKAHIEAESKAVTSLNLSESESKSSNNLASNSNINSVKLKDNNIISINSNSNINNNNNNNRTIRSFRSIKSQEKNYSNLNTKYNNTDIENKNLNNTIIAKNRISIKSPVRNTLTGSCKSCINNEKKIEELEKIISEQEILLLAYKNQEALINVNYNYNNNYNNNFSNSYKDYLVYFTSNNKKMSNISFSILNDCKEKTKNNIKNTITAESQLKHVLNENQSLKDFKNKVIKLSTNIDEFNNKIEKELYLINRLINEISKESNTYILDQKEFNKEELQVRVKESYVSLINSVKNITNIKQEEFGLMIKEKNREIESLKKLFNYNEDNELNVKGLVENDYNNSIENFYNNNIKIVENIMKENHGKSEKFSNINNNVNSNNDRGKQKTSYNNINTSEIEDNINKANIINISNIDNIPNDKIGYDYETNKDFNYYKQKKQLSSTLSQIESKNNNRNSLINTNASLQNKLKQNNKLNDKLLDLNNDSLLITIYGNLEKEISQSKEESSKSIFNYMKSVKKGNINNNIPYNTAVYKENNRIKSLDNKDHYNLEPHYPNYLETFSNVGSYKHQKSNNNNKDINNDNNIKIINKEDESSDFKNKISKNEEIIRTSINININANNTEVNTNTGELTRTKNKDSNKENNNTKNTKTIDCCQDIEESNKNGAIKKNKNYRKLFSPNKN